MTNQHIASTQVLFRARAAVCAWCKVVEVWAARRRFVGGVILICAGWFACASIAAADEDKPTAAPTNANKSAAVDFYHDVKPIFVKHCFACHGPAKLEGGLRLDLRSAFVKGGDDGPAVVAGDSGASLLIQYVTGKNEAGTLMPPKDKGSPLNEQEIATLKSWVEQGAIWPEQPGNTAAGKKDAADSTELGRADREPEEKSANSKDSSKDASEKTGGEGALSDHWAFRSVQHVKPPILRDAWINTPIDAFVFEQLQSHQLTPNPQASRLELIRRVTFDLTGLPPTPDEVQRFINDKSPDAYEHLVDRLLSSPQYGEEWGRHWLDLARYADSDGFENDSDRPNAYKYRDYVIRCFNDDKRYNQFIVEQLAGDELDEVGPDHLVALGFCRNGPTIGNQINEKNRVDEVDDVVATTSSVFLGLTVGCARCHDHKYEPISQRDYYRMFAVFNDAKKDNSNDIMHLSDPADEPRKSYVMLGGDYNRHGDEVQPGVPAVLDSGGVHMPAAKDKPSSAGRRLALARWIADAKNPLTARVIVNRIWMYHFGRALVNTPSNFGQSGDMPTHLELLDYLAEQLVHGGWHIKPITKMIVMSAVYRQSSAYDPEKSGVDGDNQWYWRYPVRRLEAESIRDSILSASGNLNPQMFGPGIKPKIPDSILTTTSKEMWPKVAQEGPEQWRRSVYIFAKRSLPVPMLEGFDAPTATQTCERRMTTVVATQALQLLNDDFSNKQAVYMAARVIHDVGEDMNRQVERAYWLAFSRPPTDSQRRQGAQFVKDQIQSTQKAVMDQHKTEAPSQQQLQVAALADLCHVLFNANEFVYVN